MNQLKGLTLSFQGALSHLGRPDIETNEAEGRLVTAKKLFALNPYSRKLALSSSVKSQNENPKKSPLLDPWVSRFPRYVARRLWHLFHGTRSLIAFSFITLGVIVTKFTYGYRTTFPLIIQQCFASGVSLMPIVTIVSCALGLTVVGQALTFFSTLGALDIVGAILGSVVVRELGPLLSAALVLARAGTGIVVELGTARATNQIETLEHLGIDPIHYLVAPRIIGVTLSVLSITVYLTLFTLVSAYGVVLLSDVPLRLSEYIEQTVATLQWEDFIVVGLKSMGFGMIISLVCCHDGLAQPITLEGVARATSKAVTKVVLLCLAVDVAFLLYLLQILN